MILRYNFDCGSHGVATSFDPMSLMDLTYFSMIDKSLDAGTLLVVITMLSVIGLMNSALKEDLTFFKRPLMELMCIPALFMIDLTCWSRRGTMACFLDGPLVVNDLLFLPFGCGTLRAALCISTIFLFGRARKASLSLSMSAACDDAWAYDIGRDNFLLLFL